MEQSGNTTAMQDTSNNWFKQNEAALKCPQNDAASTAEPLQDLHTFMDRYFKDIDEIDDQMDWDYFKDDNACDNEIQE